jgi:hypothetical protein
MVQRLMLSRMLSHSTVKGASTPSSGIGTHLPVSIHASEPRYYGFYTTATCFSLAEEGTNGANYKVLIRDIDTIAVEIKCLSDAGIPI